MVGARTDHEKLKRRRKYEEKQREIRRKKRLRKVISSKVRRKKKIAQVRASLRIFKISLVSRYPPVLSVATSTTRRATCVG